jgi:hypothetical protein
MTVRSALRIGSMWTPGRFQVLISVRGWVDPRALVRLEGLGEFKKKSVSSGIEQATFRLVEQWANQLHYCVPPPEIESAWSCTSIRASGSAYLTYLFYVMSLLFQPHFPFRFKSRGVCCIAVDRGSVRVRSSEERHLRKSMNTQLSQMTDLDCVTVEKMTDLDCFTVEKKAIVAY